MFNTTVDTYSKRKGKKRKPQRLMPPVVYEESMEFVTDKQAELYFIQHKQMHEFISKMGLIEEFNQYQKEKQRSINSDYSEWYKKWN